MTTPLVPGMGDKPTVRPSARCAKLVSVVSERVELVDQAMDLLIERKLLRDRAGSFPELDALLARVSRKDPE